MCYDIISKYSYIFDLKNYDKDHGINEDIVPEKYKELFSQAIYLDCKTIESILNQNIEQLKDKNFVVIIPSDKLKSNYYFTLYFLYHMMIRYKLLMSAEF